MRDKEVVKETGEALSCLILQNENFTVDRLDANGIDIAAYKENGDEKYGVSVKTRNVESTINDSILLKRNDLIYAAEESWKRGLEPAYAFVVIDLSRIDVLIVTQEYAFKNLLGKKKELSCSIQEYMKLHGNSKGNVQSKSLSISLKSRTKWRELEVGEGVIGVYSYERMKNKKVIKKI